MDAGPRWTEEVDDLVDAGDVDGAISLLESVVSNLSTAASPSGADLRLATALGDLAGLHASCGNTLRADDLRARAIVLRSRAAASGALGDLDDKHVSSPQSGSKSHVNEPDDRAATAATQFGTRHVLVLYDFSPSTRTTDLEKIFDKFGDHGVAIRWVNDTSALAVFRTPSAGNLIFTVISIYLCLCFLPSILTTAFLPIIVAIEAQACIPSRFKARSLKEDDDVLTKIDGTDLEPPKPRPKTSARTAQRLIAHGMGLKQFSNFGSDQLKKQEEERRNRITARQALRDEAWGSD
ncbi:hypothetical protein PR202_ga08206 [Eleusine coracana subsp. coracana]|uniref:Uncharacterized protein n=1 Tax=Eleusine coracana subsp. coracana TaxID=191504 RepID=A0AAV5C1K9_ELECO|nr:hypothetical protein PR202_ga08206 [Eleusine coracana subsp. coracana]